MVPAEVTQREAELDLARDRDAMPAIRGFVYQVDLTIARWLDLPDGDVLELERGEDIDRVARAVVAAPADHERLMEQVKYRVRPVSLTSDALRGALANFHEHARRNRPLALRFCFTTNARPARERGAALPARTTGVDAWRALHAAPRLTTDGRALLAALRAVLTRPVAPEGVRDESWQEWQQFVRDAAPARFAAFVRRVEIAVGAPDAADARTAVEDALTRHGYADSPSTAARLYARLFVAVFHRLTDPGVKRLTRRDLLAEVEADRAGAALPPDQQVTAARVAEVFGALGRQDARLAELGAGLDALRAEVRDVAAAARAEHFPLEVHAGDTAAFQRTDHWFGTRLTDGPIFHHARPLVGRDAELAAALDAVRAQLAVREGGAAAAGAVEVCAPGGRGKSRLLLELARRVEGDDAGAVRWVRAGVTPLPTSLQELPPGPVVLVCDDAHRRADLAQILRTAQARRDPTVVVLGVRPQGRAAVRAAAYEANLAFERLAELPDLPDLDPDALAPLVAEELGPGNADLAARVLRATANSPLVALVGARLLRTRAVHPEALAQDEEFRKAVLQGFRDEAIGRIADDVDAGLVRRALDVIAAVQPFDPGVADEVDVAARICHTSAPELRRAVGALEDVGVLRDDQAGLRITPDVLGDDVLARAMVAADRPTGYERELMADFGPAVLPRLVRNVAELDWQLAEGGRPVDVFGAVWTRFVDLFRDAANPDRRELLEQLPPVAAFQPARVLEFLGGFVDHPQGEERAAGWFNIRTRDADVLAKVPPLLAIIAQHRAHVRDALDLLWHLGQGDTRATRQHTDHAVRQLADVVAYARRRHLWLQEAAVDAFERWTASPGWSRHAQSPLVVAEAVLRMAVVEDAFDERTGQLTMTRVGVHGENTRALRERVVALLEGFVLGPDPRDRESALKVLLDALDPPDSQFAHVVTRAEEEGFRAQYEAVLAALERIAAADPDPLTRVRLRDGLAWKARRTALSWKQSRIAAIRDGLDETAATRRVRAVGRIAREFFGAHAFERAGRALADAADAVAREWLALRDDAALGRALDAECRCLEAAAVEPDPGRLLFRIAELDPAAGVALAAWTLAAADGATPSAGAADDAAAARWAGWLTVLLPAVRGRTPESTAYEAVLRAAAAGPHVRERAAAAAALGRVDVQAPNGAPWADHEIATLRDLLRDEAAAVRRAAAHALRYGPPAAVADLLADVRLDGDAEVAGAVADCFAYRKADERPDPDPATVTSLLAQLVDVPRFGQAADDVDAMLAVFARRDAVAVVDLLRARVRRERVARAAPTADDDLLHAWNTSYDAVPFDGFPAVTAALRASPGYPAVVRSLLAAATGTQHDGDNGAAPEVAPEIQEAVALLGSLALWDDDIARGLLDLARGADGCGTHHAIAAVMGTQSAGFLLEHHGFVGDVLAALDRCAPEAQDGVRRALLATADRGYVREVGGVNVLLERLRTEATAIAAASGGSSAGRVKRAFYRDVVAYAESTIAAQRERDARRTDRRAPPAGR